MPPRASTHTHNHLCGPRSNSLKLKFCSKCVHVAIETCIMDHDPTGGHRERSIINCNVSKLQVKIQTCAGRACLSCLAGLARRPPKAPSSCLKAQDYQTRFGGHESNFWLTVPCDWVAVASNYASCPLLKYHSRNSRAVDLLEDTGNYFHERWNSHPRSSAVPAVANAQFSTFPRKLSRCTTEHCSSEVGDLIPVRCPRTNSAAFIRNSGSSM